MPIRDGGVMDELQGPGHPNGNEHTKGSPSRHLGPSVFNNEEGGAKLRQDEITEHWKSKGNRLTKTGDNEWTDFGPE